MFTPHAVTRSSPLALVGLVLVASMLLACSSNPGDPVTDRTTTVVLTTTRAETSLLSVATAAGTTVTSGSSPAGPTSLPIEEQIAAGVKNAEANDIEQAVAVIDRGTGRLVASHAGDTTFNAESITKLFTVAYYLIQADGSPDGALADDLRSLVQESNNTVQVSLWRSAIVPFIADRYQLTGISNSAAVSPNSWGSDKITANDLATFLYAASEDPLVGPHLLTWMAGTPPSGADGFNQAFGWNALAGPRGSKQGWSDPNWSPANLHSAGYTDRYFAAVLQTSPSATYATMRSTSTTTVGLIEASTW